MARSAGTYRIPRPPTPLPSGLLWLGRQVLDCLWHEDPPHGQIHGPFTEAIPGFLARLQSLAHQSPANSALKAAERGPYTSAARAQHYTSVAHRFITICADATHIRAWTEICVPTTGFNYVMWRRRGPMPFHPR